MSETQNVCLALLFIACVVGAFLAGQKTARQQFESDAVLLRKADFIEDPCGHIRFKWKP